MEFIFSLKSKRFIRNLYTLHLIITILFFTGCADSTSSSDLIIIDTSRNYPESDLKLSDVAQVKYIPLRYGKDSTVFSNPGSLAVAVFHDTLFILNRRVPFFAQILLYDMSGNPLSKIDRQGNGPGEYITLGNFILDTLRREIYGWDRESKKMLVYDFKGNCLREKYFDNKYYDMVNISTDYLLGYNHNSQFINMFKKDRLVKTKNKTITFINKNDFTEQASGFDYAKPGIGGTQCLIAHQTVMRDGLYIANDRSDTVYFIDKHLQLKPRIVDIAPHSEGRESMILPTIETDRYILISQIFSSEYGIHKATIPKKPQFYIYDKKKQKIFHLRRDSNIQLESLLLAHDNIIISQFMLTQNYNYAVAYIAPLTLHENYKSLPPQLKPIADSLNENDNPVVMLIKFK